MEGHSAGGGRTGSKVVNKIKINKTHLNKIDKTHLIKNNEEQEQQKVPDVKIAKEGKNVVTQLPTQEKGENNKKNIGGIIPVTRYKIILFQVLIFAGIFLALVKWGKKHGQ